VPELEAKGAATWGHTRDEALRNIQEVTQLVVEELLEDDQPLPTGATITDDPVVAVHVG
jgi:predicted RNase H-like HicB family nuclease